MYEQPKFLQGHMTALVLMEATLLNNESQWDPCASTDQISWLPIISTYMATLRVIGAHAASAWDEHQVTAMYTFILTGRIVPSELEALSGALQWLALAHALQALHGRSYH